MPDRGWDGAPRFFLISYILLLVRATGLGDLVELRSLRACHAVVTCLQLVHECVADITNCYVRMS